MLPRRFTASSKRRAVGIEGSGMPGDGARVTGVLLFRRQALIETYLCLLIRDLEA
jgi:hypothetical protein